MQIGQLVAKKMNIPCYYREMTAIAAKESGLASEFVFGISSYENAVMREFSTGIYNIESVYNKITKKLYQLDTLWYGGIKLVQMG